MVPNLKPDACPYFLNKLSNAARASLGFWLAVEETLTGVPVSFSRVTRIS